MPASVVLRPALNERDRRSFTMRARHRGPGGAETAWDRVPMAEKSGGEDTAISADLPDIKKAANGIVTLAKEAESESVQLRAWRAILADQMAVSKFSDLEYRMVEIEEQLE